MTKLVIDDLRVLNIVGDVQYARNLDQAFDALYEIKKFEEIWLDHDLGTMDGRCEDIWPIVAAFEERMTYNPIKTDHIIIHTANRVGAQRLKLAFDRMGYPTTVVNAKDYTASVLPW